MLLRFIVLVNVNYISFLYLFKTNFNHPIRLFIAEEIVSIEYRIHCNIVFILKIYYLEKYIINR